MGAKKLVRKKSTVEDGDSPMRSIPLNFDLTCADALKPLIYCLRERLISSRGQTTRPRPSSLAKIDEAFDVILANLLNSYKHSPRCFVGVSRNENDYVLTRYLKRKIGFDNFILAYDYLIDAEPPLLSFFPGFNDRKTKKSFTSRMKPSGYLRSVFRRYKAITTSKDWLSSFDPVNTTLFDDLPDSSIEQKVTIPQEWIKVLPPTEIIRLKDKNGALITYKDSSYIGAMGKRLNEWNEFVSTHHHIDLLKTDAEIENLFHHGDYDEEDDASASFGDEQDRPAFVQFERFRLHRVFNNNSFDEGGRFYGAWWQRIPSEARRYITINDKPTKEFDYSNLHAAMLYAKEGLPLAEDAYSLPGVSEKHRKLVKATFFRLINAKPGQRIQKPREKLLPPNYKWGELQSAIKEKHAPIAKYLHSGIGLNLQKIDSSIAEDVMHSMMQKDYLALPIHDSFIVYSGLGALIQEEMRKAYKKHMNADVGIDPDLSFLEFELRRSPPDEGDEIPTPLEEIEWRSSDPGYEGYRARRNLFFETRTDTWDWRFGPGRNF